MTFFVIVIIIMRLILLALGLFPAYITKVIFDDILPSMQIPKLSKVLVYGTLVMLGTSLFEYLHSFLQQSFSIKMVKQSRRFFINALLNKKFSSMNEISAGDIIYRGNQDLNKVLNTIITNFIEIPLNVIYLISLIVILMKINVTLTGISLSLLVMKTIMNSYFSKRYYIIQNDQKAMEASLLDTTKRIVDRFLFIKLNRLFDSESEYYLKKVDSYLSSSKKVSLFRALVGSLSSFIGNITQFLIILFGAYFISKDFLTMGLFLSFINIVQKAGAPMEYFNSLPFVVKDFKSSYERVYPLIIYAPDKLEIISSDRNEIILECRNVTLKMGNRTILYNYNLEVKKGERVAIIGKSGAGKSTFCRMLAGIYDYDGEIWAYPDHKITNKLFAFILDECSLFNGSLRENLFYDLVDGPNIKSDKDVYQLLQIFGLDHQMQQGLDSEIHLNKLSHGEKQRLEIIRVLINQPQIIILDEATSGLDKETEEIVWNVIREQCINSAIIYISHNRDIIRDGDRIINFSADDESTYQLNLDIKAV
ncbi:MAG: hypothetical protein K0R57_4467 [Paenibacillaceae bacterium]|jgi:ABC-type bacteriocin/lantibiotic exporter with double-glycine peptidase domain|nr:hypothetical protein [Paenibacillaceae bacterium]